MKTATVLTTHTVEVPGAALAYDVRKNDQTKEPPLLMIGLPMGASGFGALAGYFPERTVVTYDPRGVERSQMTGDAAERSPSQHADDLHRLISALDGGPVDIFASSGGAVTALALVAVHPDDVRILVAHEPPTASVLPDHAEAMAAIKGIQETYGRSGFGAGMAKFIAVTSHRGPVTADVAEQPADPQMFGLPPGDDGSRNDPLLSQNMIGVTHFEPDFEALRAAPTKIVMAAGEESEGTMASRAAYAIADRLGTTPAVFPSHHGGFTSGEGGWGGKPEEFAKKLHQVLEEA